jgi:ribosome-binding protein aMBF1 (putative translation factor)
MKLGELKTNEEIHQEDLKTRPEYAELWARTVVARAVANSLIRYRTEHQLSQRALAKILGWKQPQVARLEHGEVTPGVDTMVHLARTLGMHFVVAIGDVHVEMQPGDFVEEGDQLVAAAGM